MRRTNIELKHLRRAQAEKLYRDYKWTSVLPKLVVKRGLFWKGQGQLS